MPKGKGRRARPQKTSAIITRKNIGVKNKLTGTASFSIVKTGDVSKSFLESVLKSAREYNKQNGRVILDYYVILVGKDKDGNRKSITPFGKRALNYKETFKTTYSKIEKFIKESSQKYSDFLPEELQVVLILDKEKAQIEFEDRAERSRKQRIGREKAQAKRAQLVKDVAELHALEKRRKNARLRKAGKLPPARKHKSKRK